MLSYISYIIILLYSKWSKLLGSLSDITSNSSKLLNLYSYFNSTDLVMFNSLFNLIVTILLLYFVVRLQMCIYLSIYTQP